MRKKILDNKDVLDVAELIIEKEGLDKCTMRRIARELGIAIGTLYNYYKPREALLKVPDHRHLTPRE